MKKACGIDLSLTATAVMRSNGQGQLFGRTGITNMSLTGQAWALRKLADDIVQWAETGEPDAVVIEALDMAKAYGGKIQTVVLWWEVVGSLTRFTNVHVAPSAQLKMYATGKGSGDKQAVIDGVSSLWPHFQITNSRGKPDNNLADAAAACALALEVLGEPLGQYPHAQTRALQSVLSVDQAPAPKKRVARATKRSLDTQGDTLL